MLKQFFTAALVLALACSPESSTPPASPRSSGSQVKQAPEASVVVPLKASGPQRPTTPRLISERTPLAQQVYFTQGTQTAHKKGCPEVTSKMLRMPLVAARMQGFEIHQQCASRNEVEYRTIEVVSPEWQAYESALAANQPTLPSTQSGASGPSPASPSARPSEPKDVEVKGYTRKDGTYVAPYTRSKPEKKP